MSTATLTQRTLKSYLKHEMIAPARAIKELCELVREEARDGGSPDFLAGTESMCQSAVQLFEQSLSPSKLKAIVPGGGEEAFFDLREKLNHVKGFCEALLNQAREQGIAHGPLVLGLEVIKKHCSDITRSVELLERFGQERPPSKSCKSSGSMLHLPVHGGRLLVVQGDEDTTLVRRLERLGHNVSVAADAAHALEVLAEADVDVVLLDQVLSDMDGIDLLKQLKEHERLQHVPVIMLSGLDDRELAIECIQLGAEDYLCKPVDQVLLVARIGACLEKWRLKDREYEQFFPPPIVRQLRYRRDLLTRRELNVTIMFCDIRGFSRISERLGHARTVDWVSDAMERLSNCVIAHHGVLVDFIGDGLMALWGAPEPQEDAEKQACQSALAMLDQLPDLNRKWQGQLKEAMDLGIGIHTGMAHVGNVGSSRRFKYGTLGGTVNQASRVEGATRHLRSRILITQATWPRVQGAFPLRRLGKVRLLNIPRPVEVFELSAGDGPSWEKLKLGYEDALGEFERQNFLKAIRLVGDLLDDFPDDGPADLLLSRAVGLRQHPPEVFDEVLLDLRTK